MTQPGVFTPYSTVAPLLGTLPGWVDAADQQRIASYQKYEEIYWSSEAGFQQVMRGDNEQPVFLPTARTLVNAVNRYTAPNFGFSVESINNDTEGATLTRLALEALFRREKFLSRFEGNKLFGLVRGDWLWHLLADPTKPPGKRLRIMALDPASYFPVYDEEEPDRIVKVHVAEQITVNGQVKINRLTYEKVVDEGTGQTTILRSHGIFSTEKWWELTTPEEIILPEEPLDPRITSIPVYHVKNLDTNGPFGSSELRGLESVLAAVNQAMSDEDLTLALDGLGVWATDGAGPVDDQGRALEYIFGPGRVISRANGLKKLTGTSSVTPYQDHIAKMEESAKESLGASDVAVGKVDQGTAESGVALLLKLGPMLAATAIKDKEILDVHAQLFYDLCFWLTVYEELDLLASVEGGELAPRALVTPVIGDKIPVNAAEVVKRVTDLRNTVPPIISLRTAHAWMRAAGLAVPDNELEVLAAEAAGVYDPLGEPGAGEDAAAEGAVPTDPVDTGEEVLA